MHGGNSAFAYIGSYQQNGHSLTGTVTGTRHTVDPNHPSIFGFDEVKIGFHGVAKGALASVEGTAAEAPSLNFKALLTRISD